MGATSGITEVGGRKVENILQRNFFKQSRYTGDGDLKTYTHLLPKDPYNGDSAIEKKECVVDGKKQDEKEG
ncbi:hypothetical protein ABEB36_012645 [Hypothenemus hampei]|uniref:Uncharacterized protein n=1 Tax=Hypothenemus hampei TaxID=57062 RepID=A0ABD1EBZ9_HYPHA